MDKFIKLVLIGDACVGKTTYCDKLHFERFNTTYEKSLKLNVITHAFDNPYVWTIFDCPSCENFNKFIRNRYLNSDCCIIMVDITKENPFESVKKYKKKFRKVCPEAPIIIVGNKNDGDSFGRTNIEEVYDLKYINISIKDEYQLEKPFEYLLTVLRQ